jgi:hypothetical protein
MTAVVPGAPCGSLGAVGIRVPWRVGETGQAFTPSFRASGDDSRVSRSALVAAAASFSAPELPMAPSPVPPLGLPTPAPAPVPTAPTQGSVSGSSTCQSGSYYQTGLDLAVLGAVIEMRLPQDSAGSSAVVDDRVLRRADDPGASPG